MSDFSAKAIAELDSILQGVEPALADKLNAVKLTYITRMEAAILRWSLPNSPYAQKISEVQKGTADLSGNLSYLRAVVIALRDDLKDGFFRSITDLVHAGVFSDFLEMADHLLKEDYKDAAAVIAGSSLEAHLRALCDKNGVPLDFPSSDGPKAKKADTLNADLAKATVYGKGDQKQITAWLDTRNSAAHGKYNDYTKEKVDLMIAGIRDFINRTPA